MQDGDINILQKMIKEVHDMFLLADIYLYIGQYLKDNQFPFEEYIKWKKNQK